MRGVVASATNVYLLPDFTAGSVWCVDVNPATRATNSVLLTTGLVKARAMAATAAGDLLVVSTQTTASQRGVWRYAGLGK